MRPAVFVGGHTRSLQSSEEPLDLTGAQLWLGLGGGVGPKTKDSNILGFCYPQGFLAWNPVNNKSLSVFNWQQMSIKYTVFFPEI